MFVSGQNSYFAVDNAAGVLTDISRSLNSVSDTLTATNHEIPLFGTGSVSRKTGIKDGSFSISGMWSTTIDRHFCHILGKTVSIAFGPEGSSSGKPRTSVEAVCKSFDTTVGVDGLVEFKADFENDGPITVDTF